MKCDKCGQDFQEGTACSNCGPQVAPASAPTPAVKLGAGALGVSVLGCLGLCVALGLLARIVPRGTPQPSQGSTSPSEAQPTPPPQPAADLTVTPHKLVGDYDANEVAADQAYKGKALRVTGTVEDIGKDITDSIYVTLATGHSVRTVQVFFDDEHTDAVAKLGKGDEVTVQGECMGLMLNVLIREAVFVLDPEVITERGWAKLKGDDYAAAIEEFDHALRISPGYRDAHAGRGNARLMSGDYKGAVADYDSALKTDATDYVLVSNRGFAKQFAGDLQGALADFLTVAKAQPSVEAHSYVAAVQNDLEDHEAALRTSERALALDQESHRALFERGRAQSGLGRLSQAEQTFTSVIRVAPDHPRAFFERARIREALGQVRKAALDYVLAISLDAPEVTDATRAYVRANAWAQPLSAAPPAETPAEARLREQVEAGLQRWVGPLVSGTVVLVVGDQVQVVLVGRFFKRDAREATEPAPGVHEIPIEDSITKDAVGAIRDAVDDATATLTLLDLRGEVVEDGVGVR